MKQIINVTDIVTYLYCPRKIYLKLVKKIKEPPNKAMISGFLKHKIFDLFNKNESVIVSEIKTDLSEQEIASLYENYLTSISREIISTYSNMVKSFYINPQELLEDVLNFLENEIKLRVKAIKEILPSFKGRELWRNLSPKYLTEYEVNSQELGLKGRIDRVKFASEIIPYELKTRKEIYESDKLQLAAYALLLEHEFNKKVEKGVVESKDKQEEILITEEMKNKVLEIAEIIRKMKEQAPELPSNFNKCKQCKYNENCFEV